MLAGQGYVELSGAPDLQQPPLVTLLAMIGLSLGLPLGWAAAGLAHVLLGSLVVLPMYGLARELYGQRVGLLAALLGGRLLGEDDRGLRVLGAGCIAGGVMALALG